jgi:hypothetical protein
MDRVSCKLTRAICFSYRIYFKSTIYFRYGKHDLPIMIVPRLDKVLAKETRQLSSAFVVERSGPCLCKPAQRVQMIFPHLEPTPANHQSLPARCALTGCPISRSIALIDNSSTGVTIVIALPCFTRSARATHSVYVVFRSSRHVVIDDV